MFPPLAEPAESGRNKALVTWLGTDPVHTESTARFAAQFARSDHDHGYVVGMFQAAILTTNGELP